MRAGRARDLASCHSYYYCYDISGCNIIPDMDIYDRPWWRGLT